MLVLEVQTSFASGIYEDICFMENNIVKNDTNLTKGSLTHFLTPAMIANESRSYLKAELYKNDFETFVGQDGYPCIGAQAAVNGKSYAIGLFDNMNGVKSAEGLGNGLSEYIDYLDKRASDFMTYIAIFKNDKFDSEKSFEVSLWSLLNRLHANDIQNTDWNEEVGHNPDDSDFSFSFGGKAFFMVGLHPKSSRKARRLGHTAIAFNLHNQFENLRKKGRYQKIKEAIRTNEIAFSGSINPMLNDFGEGLEAPQYSGRKVSPDWKCPFAFLGKTKL